MIEELFVIKDGERIKVDLCSPSGMTLKFNSILFNDLSTIESSKSYTFELPLTVTNRFVFANAEDVRSLYEKTHTYNAEYFVDGVSIAHNANLYITKTSDCYEANLTWNIIRPLQELQKNDVMICDLDEVDGVTTGRCIPGTKFGSQPDLDTTYDSSFPYCKADYSAGIDNSIQDNSFLRFGYLFLDPNPVVPVPYLLSRIESHYGLKLDIYNHIKYDGEWSNVGNKPAHTSDVINYGVIPQVGIHITEKYKEQVAFRLSLIHYAEKPNGISGKPFWFNAVEEDRNYYTVEDLPNKYYRGNIYSISLNDSVSGYNARYGINITSGTQVYGYIAAFFKWSDAFEGGDPINDKKNISIKFYEEGLSGEKAEEIESVDGYITSNFQRHYDERCVLVVWEMRPDHGGSLVDVRAKYNRSVFPVFSSTPVGYFNEFPETTGCFMNFCYNGAKFRERPARDIIGSLPKVSCLDFVKSLFFMAGCFPKINEDDSITMVKYNTLKDNYNNNRVYDWSDNIIADTCEISYSPSMLKSRKNYYLMGNDETKNDTNEYDGPYETKEHEDVYQSGKFSIDNEYADEDTKETIVKLPWYGSFLSSAENPSMPTGNTIKTYTLSIGNDYIEDRLSYNESKPAYGIISFKDGFMHMDVWNGFSDIAHNPDYEIFNKIFRKPMVVKSKFKIPLLELSNIDYAKPVFIEKYNSYFAIVNIEWHSDNGISDVELIKIPF